MELHYKITCQVSSFFYAGDKTFKLEHQIADGMQNVDVVVTKPYCMSYGQSVQSSFVPRNPQVI